LAAFLYVIAPTQAIKERLIALVQVQTGRTLTINGAASLTLYPALGVRLTDIVLSAPPGMDGGPFLTAAALDLQIPLLPLLQRRLVADQFVLQQPTLTLRTNRAGQKSWDFAANQTRPPQTKPDTGLPAVVDTKLAASALVAASGGSVSLASLSALRLRDVRIEDGTLVIENAATDARQEFRAIDAVVQLESIRAPAKISGSLLWRAETVPFDLEIASPLDLLEGRKSGVSIFSTAKLLQASIAGDLTLAPVPQLTGAIDMSSNTGRVALDWLGVSMPKTVMVSDALTTLALKGRIKLTSSELTLNDATLAMDGAQATGDLSIVPGPKRPLVTATLTVSDLAADTVLASAVAGATPAIGSAEPPIDVAWIEAVDADATLTLSNLTWRGLVVAKATSTLALKDRVFKLRVKDSVLHGGRGYGALLLDARKPATRIEANATVQSVQLGPVLTAALGLKTLDGKGDMTGGILAIGQTRSEMLAGMLGQSRIAISDGAIVGINVPSMIRALQRGTLTGWTDEPSARTDFSTLTATVSITKGVARNDDLLITGPLLRASGAGSIDLRQGTVDYAARPALVAPAAGQDGTGTALPKLPAIEIPLRIVGPLARPEIQPDLKGIVRSVVSNPAAAVEALTGWGLQPADPSPAPVLSVQATSVPEPPVRAARKTGATPDLASTIGAVLSTLGDAQPAEAGLPAP
jgi:AsmA protein